MNIEIEQKTTQLKNLMKVEQDEIEKMTFEKLLKFANETIFFRNDILQVLQNNEKIAKDEIEFLYNNSTTEQRNNLVKIYPEKFKDF